MARSDIVSMVLAICIAIVMLGSVFIGFILLVQQVIT